MFGLLHVTLKPLILAKHTVRSVTRRMESAAAAIISDAIVAENSGNAVADGKRKSEETCEESTKRAKLKPDKALACDQLKGLGRNQKRRVVKQLCHERHWNKTKGKPLHMLYSRTGGAKEWIVDSEYYFENGFRKVKPYFFDFNTFCKGRWVGKTLGELYNSEFRLYPREYYERLREKGRILLNLETVENFDVKIKDNDMLTSRIHRHEGPVIDAPIEIIEDSSKFLVVNKPSSIPIHPCGRYRMNSLVFILQNEYGYKNLSGCHRIDRPTSGLMMFAKTKHVANEVHRLIQSRKVEKEYLCKVVGEFPEMAECKQPVTSFNEKLGFQVAWKVEGLKSKDAWTLFERVSTDGETSIVICRPKTGRTHQIRVHLQYLGHPIVNDPVYNHESWGPERFQVGPVTKDLDQVVQGLTAKYDQCVAAKIQAKNSNEEVSQPAVCSDGNTTGNVDGTGGPRQPDNANNEISSDLTTQSSAGVGESSKITSPPPIRHLSGHVVAPSPTSPKVDEGQTKSTEDLKPAKPSSENPSPSRTSTSNTNPNAWEKVDDCPDCNNHVADPRPEDLVMFLHAYKYKSEDWEFQTKLPEWAKST